MNWRKELLRGHPYGTNTPTIFNVVVDALIRHWVTVMDGEEAGPEVFGQSLQWLAEIFYADDGLLASPQTACLQETLDA